MKKFLLVLIAAAVLVPAATAAVSPPSPTTAAQKLLTYANAQVAAVAAARNAPVGAYFGSATCTTVTFPTWGKPPVQGVTFYCVAQVVNQQGHSLGLGRRGGFEVIALRSGGWRFIQVLPTCAPPHFCDPKNDNVGGALTPG